MKTIMNAALARSGTELGLARQAVDEYFADSAEPVFLRRVDYTARLLIKRDGEK